MFCGTTVQKLRRHLKRNPQKGLLDELLGVWKYCNTFRNNKDPDRSRVCVNVYSFLQNAAHNNIVQKLEKQKPAVWLLSSSTCLELSINLWKNKLFIILIRTSLQRQHFQNVTIQKKNIITSTSHYWHFLFYFLLHETIWLPNGEKNKCFLHLGDYVKCHLQGIAIK